jgi:hypothetical protein
MSAGAAKESRETVGLYLNRRLRSQGVYNLNTVNRETDKNLGVRRRYPPVLNDARYTDPVGR